MSSHTGSSAYHAILADGRISKGRREVYRLLYEHLPEDMTGGEINRVLAPGQGNPGFHVRAGELEALGVLDIRERPDSVTGMVCKAYRPNDRMPDFEAFDRWKEAQDKGKKPAKKAMLKAMAELHDICLKAHEARHEFSVEFMQLAQWLEMKSGAKPIFKKG